MDIQHNISLKPYNTFGVEAKAKAFAEIRDRKDMRMLFQSASILPVPADKSNFLILGGGSNVLFTGDYDGLVAKMAIKGIEITGQDEDHVWVQAGAGEDWDGFVEYCLEKGFGGLENLSGIPGSVGAAPIQNIGAYGTELKETFDSLTAYDLETGEEVNFSKAACRFGYRDSIFKHGLKGKVIILSVTFRLEKKPVFNLSYRSLKEKLAGVPEDSLALRVVREAVIAIRSSKLPDPEELGNAGSFFKNPQVSEDRLKDFLDQYPEMPYFPVEGGEFKIAAGWLIEQCGWKGHREGDAGVHDMQALVLVNHGSATGKQILALAMKVRDSVNKKFGIQLEPEVQVV